MLKEKILLTDQENDGFIKIPLSTSFSANTRQEEILNAYVEDISQKSINPTIDYEKIKLYPADKDGNLVDSLSFLLHFYEWDPYISRLTKVGFTGDDVLNKSKRLQKTFLRLSFYDSDDLKTQNLLYFSNIFIDSDELYKQYITDGFVMDDIIFRFFVPNPNLSKKTRSFEGFNIYLFKDDLSKNTTKTIYMRVDFNNAIDGSSTLFLKPKTGNPSEPYNLNDLYKDLFYEISCEYDAVNKIYKYKFTQDSRLYKNPTYFYKDEEESIKTVLGMELYQAKVK